jgi:glyoxylate utilization-related uncharacterized protein
MEPYLIPLQRKRNEKPGYLVPIEETDIGFPIRRVFHISGMDESGKRGYHGHRETTTQCLVCLQGRVEVEAGGKQFILDNDETALVVPPDNYIVMHLSKHAILLVLCSTLYKEDVIFQQ